MKEYFRKYREENKEALRKYREENKEAISEYNRKYYQENKEARLEYRRKYYHGITQEQYKRMLESQQGRCAICRRTESGNKKTDKLFVDHCHRTGKIRKLLCHLCNSGIGKLGDDPTVLQAAIDYLKSFV